MSENRQRIPKPLRRNVKRIRGRLVFKAHRLAYHSTLGSRVINKKKKTPLVLRPRHVPPATNEGTSLMRPSPPPKDHHSPWA